MTTDTDILDAVLRHEGWPRFTDHPADRGGPTKGGITLETLARWRGRATAVADLRALSEAEARDIYRRAYIEGPRFDRVEDGLLRWHAVDCGVLHGTTRATRWLQEATGAPLVIDGIIGPKTLTALAAAGPHATSLRLAAIRQRFIGAIISGKHSQAVFAAGWANRAASFVELESRAGAR